MSSSKGMEKFSHLEDKIYLTLDFAKTIRAEKEKLEKEIVEMRKEVGVLAGEKERIEGQIEDLMNERDAIQLKVEAMLDAITVIEPDVKEVLRG